MNDFDAFKTVYLLFFKDNNPANTLVMVGPSYKDPISFIYYNKTIQYPIGVKTSFGFTRGARSGCLCWRDGDRIC